MIIRGFRYKNIMQQLMTQELGFARELYGIKDKFYIRCKRRRSHEHTYGNMRKILIAKQCC